MKDMIVNAILNDMTSLLNGEQIQALGESLIRNLYRVEIVEMSTELSTSCADNETALKLYAMSLTVEQHSKKTMNQYLHQIKLLFDFLGKDFREINHEDIKYYLAFMSKKKNWKPITVDNTRKFIKSFFSWADANDYINKNPFAKIKPFKVVQAKKCTLSDNEIEILRDATQSPLELAVVDILNATGLRVSELCLLNRNDIDIATGKVNVYAPKTQTWRTVYLDAKARKHVNDYFLLRKDNETAAFVTKGGCRIYSQQIQRLLQNLAQSAGIAKRITVHTFRKTLASRLFRRHVDLLTIANILGHASTATTEKYYIKVDCVDIQYKYDLVS